jgi:hypothetical protein
MRNILTQSSPADDVVNHPFDRMTRRTLDGAHTSQQTRQKPHEKQQLQLQPTPQPRHPAHRATPHRATAQRATPHLPTAHLPAAHRPPQRPQALWASCISSLIDLRFSWSNT